MRKAVLVILVLGLGAGGFLYWWNNQTDIRELNKTLPEGVKVAKSLFGEEYKVVNKIDGYEFKVPKEWRGINEIVYIPEREEMGYVGTSLNFSGGEGVAGVAIDRFRSGGNMNEELESWAKLEFNTFGLVGDFNKDVIGKVNVVKTQENVHFGGDYVYFLKSDKIIYSITSSSEEFIKYIILNGKW